MIAFKLMRRKYSSSVFKDSIYALSTGYGKSAIAVRIKKPKYRSLESVGKLPLRR
jgi:hypothetical protein